MKLQAVVPGSRSSLPAISLLCAGLISGCADIEHIGWQLASSTKPALMQISGQLLEGEVQMRPDRTGAIRMAGEGSIASCAGSLRFTAVNSGAMDMRCSDGSMFDMRFALVNEVKGYAFGTLQESTVALTFGMDVPEAQAYLARASAKAAVGAAPVTP